MGRGFIQEGAAEVFHNVLREIKAREDLANPRPSFDPGEHKDYLQREADGRKSSAYRKALRYHGFTYVPKDQLLPMDGRAHEEGMWRHPQIGAFYPSDLTTLFKGGPEQFDKWCREQRLIHGIGAKKPPKPELRKILARQK